MSPAMASIFMEDDIQKASKIHILALYYILLSLLSRYKSDTLL